MRYIAVVVLLVNYVYASGGNILPSDINGPVDTKSKTASVLEKDICYWVYRVIFLGSKRKKAADPATLRSNQLFFANVWKISNLCEKNNDPSSTVVIEKMKEKNMAFMNGTRGKPYKDYRRLVSNIKKIKFLGLTPNKVL